jgi:Trk-type K+ transport system membrane component
MENLAVVLSAIFTLVTILGVFHFLRFIRDVFRFGYQGRRVKCKDDAEYDFIALWLTIFCAMTAFILFQAKF